MVRKGEGGGPGRTRRSPKYSKVDHCVKEMGGARGGKDAPFLSEQGGRGDARKKPRAGMAMDSN